MSSSDFDEEGPSIEFQSGPPKKKAKLVSTKCNMTSAVDVEVKTEVVIYLIFVRFEVFTAVTMNNTVFWDVASCRSFVSRRFGGILPPSSG
jgi:hypothetical protein